MCSSLFVFTELKSSFVVKNYRIKTNRDTSSTLEVGSSNYIFFIVEFFFVHSVGHMCYSIFANLFKRGYF